MAQALLQMEEVFMVKEYKHTHTHIHTHIHNSKNKDRPRSKDGFIFVFLALFIMSNIDYESKYSWSKCKIISFSQHPCYTHVGDHSLRKQTSE